LLDTLELGECDQWLLALTNAEHVGKTGGEGVTIGILNVYDFVGTWMVLNVHQLSDTTNVVSTRDEHSSSILKFNDFLDFTCLKVQLDGIVLLDIWLRESDGSAIMSHNIRNFVFAKALALHFAQLETCLLSIDANWLEASLDVVHNTEVLTGFWDLNDVLEAKWETWISSDFVVHLNISLSVVLRCKSADFDRVLAV